MIHHGSFMSSSFTDKDRITCIDIARDVIATGDYLGNITLLSIKSTHSRLKLSTEIKVTPPSLNNHLKVPLTCVCVSECMKYLAVGTLFGSVIVFNIYDKLFHIVHSYDDHKNNAITSLQWSKHNSHKLFSGCEGGLVLELDMTIAEDKILSFLPILGKKSITTVCQCNVPVHSISCSIADIFNNALSDLVLLSSGHQTFLFQLPISADHLAPRYCEINENSSSSSSSSKTNRNGCKSSSNGNSSSTYLQSACIIESCSNAMNDNYSFAIGIYVIQLSSIDYHADGNDTYRILYCNINGEIKQTFNLKWKDRCNNRNLADVGIRYLHTFKESQYKHVLVAVTKSDCIVSINMQDLTMEYIDMKCHDLQCNYFNACIHQVCISDYNMIVLHEILSQEVIAVDLLTLIDPSSATIHGTTVYSSMCRLKEIIKCYYLNNKYLSSSSYHDDRDEDGNGMYSATNYNGRNNFDANNLVIGASLRDYVGLGFNASEKLAELEEAFDNALVNADTELEKYAFDSIDFKDINQQLVSCKMLLDDIAEKGAILDPCSGTSLSIELINQLESLQRCTYSNKEEMLRKKSFDIVSCMEDDFLVSTAGSYIIDASSASVGSIDLLVDNLIDTTLILLNLTNSVGSNSSAIECIKRYDSVDELLADTNIPLLKSSCVLSSTHTSNGINHSSDATNSSYHIANINTSDYSDLASFTTNGCDSSNSYSNSHLLNINDAIPAGTTGGGGGTGGGTTAGTKFAWLKDTDTSWDEKWAEATADNMTALCVLKKRMLDKRREARYDTNAIGTDCVGMIKVYDVSEMLNRSYSVTLDAPTGIGLSLKILILRDTITCLRVEGFHRLECGSIGPAEEARSIHIGDLLYGMNDINFSDYSLLDIGNYLRNYQSIAESAGDSTANASLITLHFYYGDSCYDAVTGNTGMVGEEDTDAVTSSFIDVFTGINMNSHNSATTIGIHCNNRQSMYASDDSNTSSTGLKDVNIFLQQSVDGFVNMFDSHHNFSMHAGHHKHYHMIEPNHRDFMAYSLKRKHMFPSVASISCFDSNVATMSDIAADVWQWRKLSTAASYSSYFASDIYPITIRTLPDTAVYDVCYHGDTATTIAEDSGPADDAANDGGRLSRVTSYYDNIKCHLTDCSSITIDAATIANARRASIRAETTDSYDYLELQGYVIEPSDCITGSTPSLKASTAVASRHVTYDHQCDVQYNQHIRLELKSLDARHIMDYIDPHVQERKSTVEFTGLSEDVRRLRMQLPPTPVTMAIYHALDYYRCSSVASHTGGSYCDSRVMLQSWVDTIAPIAINHASRLRVASNNFIDCHTRGFASGLELHEFMSIVVDIMTTHFMLNTCWCWVICNTHNGTYSSTNSSNGSSSSTSVDSASYLTIRKKLYKIGMTFLPFTYTSMPYSITRLVNIDSNNIFYQSICQDNWSDAIATQFILQYGAYLNYDMIAVACSILHYEDALDALLKVALMNDEYAKSAAVFSIALKYESLEPFRIDKVLDEVTKLHSNNSNQCYYYCLILQHLSDLFLKYDQAAVDTSLDLYPYLQPYSVKMSLLGTQKLLPAAGDPVGGDERWIYHRYLTRLLCFYDDSKNRMSDKDRADLVVEWTVLSFYLASKEFYHNDSHNATASTGLGIDGARYDSIVIQKLLHLFPIESDDMIIAIHTHGRTSDGKHVIIHKYGLTTISLQIMCRYFHAFQIDVMFLSKLALSYGFIGYAVRVLQNHNAINTDNTYDNQRIETIEILDGIMSQFIIDFCSSRSSSSVNEKILVNTIRLLYYLNAQDRLILPMHEQGIDDKTSKKYAGLLRSAIGSDSALAVLSMSTHVLKHLSKDFFLEMLR